MLKLVICLFAINSVFAGDYNRKEWKHWIDTDKDCKNTRHEILESRSLSKVTYRKSKRGYCSVLTGEWDDFFYPEKIYKAIKSDIDHIVPLKHAHDSGGEKWSKKLKKEFANDLENLVITNRSYNRQKGAKTIAEWLPSNREYACKYVKRWFYIKEKYKLTISDSEFKTKKILNCN